MFLSIPVDSKQIVTTTPIGARSITHVFFENKNDGVFLYKRDIDTITISIDGKVIARQMPVMPFVTSVPHGINQHHWETKALEVNLNVNVSEIKISASNINDYNVVFVCSDEELDESRGFDFVEYKRIKLKEVLTDAEAKAIVDEHLSNACTILDMAKIENKNNAEVKAYALSKGWTEAMLGYMMSHYVTVNTTGRMVLLPLPPFSRGNGQVSAHLYNVGINIEGGHHTIISRGRIEESMSLYYKKLYNANMTPDWAKDTNITLDVAPKKMFIMSLASLSKSTDDNEMLYYNDVKTNVTLNGVEHSELPVQFDASLMACTDSNAWRKVVYEFTEEMPRSFSIKLGLNAPTRYNGIPNVSPYTKYGEFTTWDMYFIFMYKKLI